MRVFRFGQINNKEYQKHLMRLTIPVLTPRHLKIILITFRSINWYSKVSSPSSFRSVYRGVISSISTPSTVLFSSELRTSISIILYLMLTLFHLNDLTKRLSWKIHLCLCCESPLNHRSLRLLISLISLA